MNFCSGDLKSFSRNILNTIISNNYREKNEMQIITKSSIFQLQHLTKVCAPYKFVHQVTFV